MPKSNITEMRADGEEIFDIIDKLEPVLKDETAPNAVIACLSLAIMLQNPSLALMKLQEAVLGASRWIALFLSANELPGADIPKEKLN